METSFLEHADILLCPFGVCIKEVQLYYKSDKFTMWDCHSTRCTQNLWAVKSKNETFNRLHKSDWRIMKIVSLAICMFKKNSEKNLSRHLEHAIFACILLILVGFCDAPLCGLSHLLLDRLQYVQNCSAWLVTRSWSSEYITDQFFVDYIGDELC